MSYCETTFTASFTSTAGEDTAAKVAEIISSLSTDIFTLASEETGEEQKQSIISKYETYTHNDLDVAVDSMSADDAIDRKAPEDLTEALTNIVSISGNKISFRAQNNEMDGQDTNLFWAVLTNLLPLMEESYTKVSTNHDDSREGITTILEVLYKDGTVKSLDEVLAAA